MSWWWLEAVGGASVQDSSLIGGCCNAIWTSLCCCSVLVQAREQLVAQSTTLEGLKAELKAAQDSKAALQVSQTIFLRTATDRCVMHARACALTLIRQAGMIDTGWVCAIFQLVLVLSAQWHSFVYCCAWLPAGVV